MKIAVIGSRDFKRLDIVREYVLGLPADTVIISGGAMGVDRTAVQTAKSRGLRFIEHLPDYERYGRHIAPKIRNFDIANECDKLVCFWDGLSTDSTHCLAAATWLGKEIEMKLERTLMLPAHTRQMGLFEDG